MRSLPSPRQGWLVLLCLVAGSQLLLGATNFEGLLDVTSWHNNAVFKHEVFPFSAQVEGRQWLIKVLYGPNYHQSFGSDGTNNYSVLADPGMGMDLNGGYIDAGVYPGLATYHIAVPWLAFASYSLTSRQPGGLELPAPWVQATLMPQAYLYSVEGEFLDESGEFLKRLEYRYSHQRILAAREQPGLKQTQLEGARVLDTNVLTRAYRDHSLAGVYEVTESKPMGGRLVPVAFQLTAYQPGVTDADSIKLIEFKGSVTNLFLSEVESFLPASDKRISVLDYRFFDRAARLEGYHYMVDDGQWPVEISADLRDRYEQYLANHKGKVASHESFNRTLRLVFALVVLSLPVFLVVRMVVLRGRQRPGAEGTEA